MLELCLLLEQVGRTVAPRQARASAGDYPLHRYYLRSKQSELTLGSTTRQLVRLGATLAG